MGLDERLSTIAEFIPRGTKVADIGTDHAYLPVFLVIEGYTPLVIAGEVNMGPYAAAKDNITKRQLQDKILLRFGDGLFVLSPGEVETVIIAGMGGITIIDILEACPDITAIIKYLILQPMVAAAQIRKWLVANGWYIYNEALVIDEDRLYEIICAQRGCGEQKVLEAADYEIGPVLWRKKPSQLKRHIANLIAKTETILSAITAGGVIRDLTKYNELILKLKQLEERYKCI